MKRTVLVVFLLCLAVLKVVAADATDAAQQVTPEELAKQLQSGNAPLILNVGPRVLYDQAHIRGAEYVGAASSEEGRAKLREYVKTFPKDKAIVLYCGCCPWEHCPNIRPALAEVQKLGFTNVKALFVAHNIGADWVEKGYPVDKGK